MSRTAQIRGLVPIRVIGMKAKNEEDIRVSPAIDNAPNRSTILLVGVLVSTPLRADLEYAKDPLGLIPRI